jgi:hypothetical protein
MEQKVSSDLAKFWGIVASVALALYSVGAAHFQLGSVDIELDRNRDADGRQWKQITALRVQVAKLESALSSCNPRSAGPTRYPIAPPKLGSSQHAAARREPAQAPQS